VTQEQIASSITAPDWDAVRAQFLLSPDVIYMNTGWSGPSPRQVVEAIEARLRRESELGSTMPDVRHEKAQLMRDARAAVAGLIGARDDEVAVMYNTTEGVNAVLNGLQLGPDDEIVTCNLEHSSVMVPCYHQREFRGVPVTVVRSSSDDDVDAVLRRFEEAIASRTRVLVLSHISYNRGTRLPVDRIIALAHRAGALVLVDGAQSAGQIPVDVRALDADFYALPAHKYLFGPEGLGALYVRHDLIERLVPTAVAHGASVEYDFEGGFQPERASMKKFELTTHSGALLAGFIEAIAFAQQIGLPAVEARCRELAWRAAEGFDRIPGVEIKSPRDPALRSGLITFAIEGQDPNQTCAALWRTAGVVGRVVNDKRVRLAMAVCNSEAEGDRAVAAVERLARDGLPPDTPSGAEYSAYIADDED
jgi:L-cysteine/cystine lyase